MARDRHPNAPAVRVPPHSVDAEQAVLGGLMLVPRAWWDVCDLVTSNDFYVRYHSVIWLAIKELAESKPPRPFDAVTLGEWFERHGRSHELPEGYLIELASTTPSAANIRSYAEIVADKAKMRRVIEIGMRITEDAFAAGHLTAFDLIGSAQTRLGQLLSDQPCELEPLAPVMDRAFSQLEERSHNPGTVHGLSTGFQDFDAVLGGLKPGGLYVLAARPKQGKTTFAQNIAEHVALVRRQPVAVFSFEMQPSELGDRMLSSIGGVDGNRIRSGELDDIDWSNVTRAMKELRGAEIYVSRPRNARVEHVVAQARRQHSRKPLGLIALDYLQLMEVASDNRAQGLGEITRALKLMAGEIGVPILLLSQLNRDLEKRPDKRPILADLRDSGSIEQDADAVIFIYRDEWYHRDSRYKGTAEIIVGAQRNGPTDTIRVLYQPHLFRFSNLPDDWEPAPLPPAAEKEGAPRRFKKSKAVAAGYTPGGDE